MNTYKDLDPFLGLEYVTLIEKDLKYIKRYINFFFFCFSVLSSEIIQLNHL